MKCRRSSRCCEDLWSMPLIECPVLKSVVMFCRSDFESGTSRGCAVRSGGRPARGPPDPRGGPHHCERGDGKIEYGNTRIAGKEKRSGRHDSSDAASCCWYVPCTMFPVVVLVCVRSVVVLACVYATIIHQIRNSYQTRQIGPDATIIDKIRSNYKKWQIGPDATDLRREMS